MPKSILLNNYNNKAAIKAMNGFTITEKTITVTEARSEP